MIRGADFSSNQDQAALERALTRGIRFAFVKLTEGVHYLNPQARHQLQRLRVHGVRCGVYHYLDPASPADYQWHHFHQALEQLPQHQELIVALDYEAPGTDAQAAAAFIADAHAAGYRVGLYHSASGFPRLGQDWSWVAAWGNQQPRDCAFWQFQAGQGGDPDWDVYTSPLPLATFWDRYAGHHAPSSKRYRVRFAGKPPVSLGPYKTLRRAAAAALAYALRHPRRPSFTVSRNG